jgi:hypothetical protein
MCRISEDGDRLAGLESGLDARAVCFIRSIYLRAGLKIRMIDTFP